MLRLCNFYKAIYFGRSRIIYCQFFNSNFIMHYFVTHYHMELILKSIPYRCNFEQQMLLPGG